MARRLIVVEQVFTIRGKGVIVLPVIEPIQNERFDLGDEILLKFPNGNERQVTIDGLDVFSGPGMAVLLKGLVKADVPIGTEVWSIDKPL